MGKCRLTGYQRIRDKIIREEIQEIDYFFQADQEGF